MLAPLSLVVFTVALLFVVVGSLRSGGGEGGQPPAATGGKVRRGARPARRVTGAVYTVKTGDTLGRIAAKTGLPVARLQRLNPQLDPQALVSGQKIRLRP
jgi:Tfp pilus assembly protein FimV